uniref:Uncharacterized protein n=1 Tax=Arundo donax TaxID=35708 RepID=A0A0A9APF1_ARUDO
MGRCGAVRGDGAARRVISPHKLLLLPASEKLRMSLKQHR